MTKLTKAHLDILALIAGLPDGTCRISWLADTISFRAYRDLREDGKIVEKEQRSGFTVVSITPAGRAAQEEQE